MKIGDYVRFDYHRISVPIQIAKVIESHYDNEDDSICYSTDVGLVIDEGNLVKEPSPNIIDLIEVGDYINGERVIALEKDVNKRNIYPSNVGAKIFTDYEFQGNWYFGIQEEDIKTVVTKEQFEAIQYEVEQ